MKKFLLSIAIVAIAETCGAENDVPELLLKAGIDMLEIPCPGATTSTVLFFCENQLN